MKNHLLDVSDNGARCAETVPTEYIVSVLQEEKK